MIRHVSLQSTFLTVLLLLAPAAGRSQPVVEGAVLGAGAGAAIGGGKGAAVGALLGGVGGGAVRTKEQEEQARWADYYRQQGQAAAQQEVPTRPAPGQAIPGPDAPIPTGSGLIKEIQRSLIALGYDPGPVDGLTDGPTINAIRNYQEDHGLMTTGKASKDLLIHMRQLMKTEGGAATASQSLTISR